MKRKNSKLKNRLHNRLKLINLAKHKNLDSDDVLYLKKCVFNCDDTIITYHDIKCALRFNKIRKDIESITIKHYMTAMAPCLAPVMADGPKAVMHYFDY
jgi:hypothetical protein